jgi:hypothetical protein
MNIWTNLCKVERNSGGQTKKLPDQIGRLLTREKGVHLKEGGNPSFFSTTGRRCG